MAKANKPAQASKPAAKTPVIKKPMVNIPTDSESIVSMILGAMVVVVLGALVFSYVRDWRQGKQQEQAEAAPETQDEQTIVVEELPTQVMVEKNDKGENVPANLPAKYVVKAGDSTWKIAEAFYGSGFNYVDIEQANSLQSQQELTVGQELTIPKVPVRSATQAGMSGETQVKSSNETSAPTGPAKGDDSMDE